MQAYFHSDPIASEDQSAIRRRLREELPDLQDACAAYRPDVLIGSAGAFETFAAMLLKNVDVKSISSASLDMEEYKVLAEKLVSSSHAERAAMPDLIPLRVDMIVIAALITSYVIENIGLRSISLSTYDLKMGVLYSIWEDQKFTSAL
jgi:exopolyphosphatase/guanosine-5'-triphosphate,3'-diphosphate pyrophosphatase